MRLCSFVHPAAFLLPAAFFVACGADIGDAAKEGGLGGTMQISGMAMEPGPDGSSGSGEVSGSVAGTTGGSGTASGNAGATTSTSGMAGNTAAATGAASGTAGGFGTSDASGTSGNPGSDAGAESGVYAPTDSSMPSEATVPGEGGPAAGCAPSATTITMTLVGGHGHTPNFGTTGAVCVVLMGSVSTKWDVYGGQGRMLTLTSSTGSMGPVDAGNSAAVATLAPTPMPGPDGFIYWNFTAGPANTSMDAY